MIKEINVTNLITQEGEISAGIHEVDGSADEEKILKLILKSTTGPIPVALKIVDILHKSKVDSIIECSGEISPGGLLLAAAGKPKNRIAHYSTTFRLTDGLEEGKAKTKDPFISCLFESLISLGARKSELAKIMKNQHFMTAIDCKRLKIIDDAGLVQNKYKQAKKNEEASKTEVVAEQAAK